MTDFRRYMGAVAALLLLAAVLFATAARQVAARPEPPVTPVAFIRPEPGVPAAPPTEPRDTPAPGATPPAFGALLEAARERLRKGESGPAEEVDRWALHLASEAETSQAALARYHAYRPLVLEALNRYGLPLDLAFVAWVESEWRNDATSRAGAAGIWQFMPATARGYGLEVSAYVDERRDPVRATYAAVRHLADLHRATNDWNAALAAYNAGLGRAGHTRGAFWSRRGSLPLETRLYVPRVLAAARVGRAPEGWGLRPLDAPPLRFRQVWVRGGTPLSVVAKRTGTSPRAVRDLNPHLVRGITPPGRRWPVRIPPPADRLPGAGRPPA